MVTSQSFGCRWRGLSRFTALILGAVLVLAACSSTATAPQSTLQKVLASGTLRVAIIVGKPGFAVADPNGNLVGYEADIANLLGKDMGVKVQFTETDSPGRVTLVQTGKADMAIGTFSQTLQRMEVINFSHPIEQEIDEILTTPAHTNLNKVSDFNQPGIKIALATGTLQVQEVTSILPLATRVVLPTDDDTLQALLSGQVDAETSGNIAIPPLLKAYPGKLKTVSGTLSAAVNDGIGLPLGDFTWANFVNAFVDQINGDGTTYTLWQKYMGPGTCPSAYSIPPAGAPSCGS